MSDQLTDHNSCGICRHTEGLRYADKFGYLYLCQQHYAKNQRRYAANIARMTPGERAYDTMQGVPSLAYELAYADQEDGRAAECCSCHINPPCQFCVDGGGDND